MNFDAPDVEMEMSEASGGLEGSGLKPVKVEHELRPASIPDSPAKGKVTGVPAPEEETPPRASASVTSASEMDPDALMCEVCSKRAREKKNRYCRICKSDIQAARRGVLQQGTRKKNRYCRICTVSQLYKPRGAKQKHLATSTICSPSCGREGKSCAISSTPL